LPPDTLIRHFHFENGSVQLHAVEAGDPAGTKLVLLHGFPEFWSGWRHQIAPLAAAGYHVIAPDGRGYNLSDKPGRVQDYSLDKLVSDVVALYEHLGRQPLNLVGHDWGAAVAWAVAGLHPGIVRRLVILNVPHPAVMQKFLLTHPRQLMRSWYMFFFQVRHLPEILISARRFALARRALLRTSRPATFTEADLAHYQTAWSQPGALTGMINWYGALASFRATAQIPDIAVPTLILWGKRDAFLLPQLAELSLKRCKNAELVWFENATHWLQHEEAQAVNQHILDFLDSKSSHL
jgi:pimeloyl-ACP methyl ester carboxylesterase